MPLTPLDIHNKEFRKTFRGYSEEEVDEFLDEVVRDYEGLIKENARLREELTELREKLDHYRSMEETMHNALVLAQNTAEEVKASARKEAELIIREAEHEAQRLKEKAEEELDLLRTKAEEIGQHIRLLRTRLRTMIQSHLDLIDEQEKEFVGDETKIFGGEG